MINKLKRRLLVINYKTKNRTFYAIYGHLFFPFFARFYWLFAFLVFSLVDFFFLSCSSCALEFHALFYWKFTQGPSGLWIHELNGILEFHTLISINIFFFMTWKLTKVGPFGPTLESKPQIYNPTPIFINKFIIKQKKKNARKPFFFFFEKKR